MPICVYSCLFVYGIAGDENFDRARRAPSRDHSSAISALKGPTKERNSAVRWLGNWTAQARAAPRPSNGEPRRAHQVMECSSPPGPTSPRAAVYRRSSLLRHTDTPEPARRVISLQLSLTSLAALPASSAPLRAAEAAAPLPQPSLCPTQCYCRGPAGGPRLSPLIPLSRPNQPSNP